MARPRTTSDEAILAATARAVSRRGPARLTLAAVAEEAGLAPATLVQRFGSKRNLLLALARQAEQHTGAVFDRARREHGSGLAAVHAATAAMAAGVQTPEEMAGSLGFLQLDLTDPEFRAHAAAQAHRMRAEVTALLTDAVAAGELADGTDVVGLARGVQVSYNGALLLWAVEGGGSPAELIRAELDRLLRPHQA
ncbi:TetR/AcrR family transcriptional regulator [Micromonospora cremea]|uniref:Transcriptional repressor n=1 Tax=Micromonospora cremea TaxID=709881 RepID=A0A1N5UDI6_9ACTN|nr:TetR/AcrR family transcriptional regulator [Micromonospora cremea]SIM57999.1 transcriptional repressor [Micromonospora cremea]